MNPKIWKYVKKKASKKESSGDYNDKPKLDLSRKTMKEKNKTKFVYKM